MKKTDIWEKLDKALDRDKAPTGQGWYTPKQFAQTYGVTVEYARQLLKSYQLSGLVKKWTGVIPGIPGRHTLYSTNL